MARKVKVLIAYDGSKAAEAALYDLRQAGLPAEVDAKILTVADLWVPPVDVASGMVEGWYGPALEAAGQQAKAAKKQAQSLCDRAEKYLASEFPQWKIKTQVLVDHPAQGILSVAETYKPHLIVLGSHGHNALGRLLLGSVSLKVLHHAHTSVRIVREGKTRGSLASSPLVLIALDGSPDARSAVESMVSRTWPKGTHFQLLVVVDERLRLAGATVTRKGKPAVLKAEGWLQTLIESAESILAQSGHKVTASILEGDPRQGILNTIKKIKPTTLVMGSRGMNGLQRFVMGSVSNDAALHAPCTVEIVRGKF